MDSYNTIQAATSGLYRESGSKFISMAIPVTGEEEISEKISRLHKDYFDATHICYAYSLAGDVPLMKAHDAGEPKHSAGDPILNEIRSKDLFNVLVVVVRYFGGTKLGLAGLTRAYRLAAGEALAKTVRIEKLIGVNLSIRFDPAVTGEVMHLIRGSKQEVIEFHFTDQSTVSLEVRKSAADTFRDKLERMKGVIII